MIGSWHLGKLAGIDVRIHWTFLLLPVWVYFSSLASGSGTAAATMAVLFVLAIFGCVVLHELGHALTARQFGIPTRDITLLPIGGVASLQRMPRNPWQELAIAVAGPAVNVVIATAIFGGLSMFAIGGPGPDVLLTFLSRLAWVNVALVVFNMIPAFPMDGGRVLRAGLAMFMPYQSATEVAAGIGQIVAAGLAFVGLMTGQVMLVLVAGFVFLAARGEAMAINQPKPTQTRPVSSDRAHPDVRSLPIVSVDWTAKSALGWLSSSSIDDFLVSSHGKVIGIIHKTDLLHAVQEGRGAWAIERLLQTHVIPLHTFHAAS